MFPIRLVTLLLCVLFPLSSLAQAAAPSQSEAIEPPLVPASEEPASESEEPQGELIPRDHVPGGQPSSSERVPLQLLAGTAASAGTMLLSYGAIVIATADCRGDLCGLSEFAVGVIAGAVSLTVAPPLAMWLVGRQFDDRGRFWPTLAGSALGLAGSLLTLSALSNHASTGVLLVLAGLWPVIGSLAGHELTRAPVPSRFVSSEARVLPMVSVSRHGGLVGGLVGSF
jgi:hypothetical protein